MPIPEWEDEIKKATPKSKSPPGSAAGCLIMSALSVAIVIATVVLGIQTKGGCELVAGYLKRQTGLDLTVGGANLTWPMVLTLTDVQTQPSTTPLGGFKAREIRMGVRWDGMLDLFLLGASLDVVKTADGWAPTAFEKIASLSDVRDTTRLFDDDPRLVSLDVRDSAIFWDGSDGERLAAAEGLGISMRPVALGDRKVRLFDVTARTVRRISGLKGRAIERMWISAAENPYLEVEYRGAWEGDVKGGVDWWATPPSIVKRGAGNEK